MCYARAGKFERKHKSAPASRHAITSGGKPVVTIVHTDKEFHRFPYVLRVSL